MVKAFSLNFRVFTVILVTGRKFKNFMLSVTTTQKMFLCHKSCVMGKPVFGVFHQVRHKQAVQPRKITIYVAKNKGADQLHGNCAFLSIPRAFMPTGI